MAHRSNKKEIKNDDEGKCEGTTDDGIQGLYSYRLNTFIEVVPDGQQDKMSFWIAKIKEAKMINDVNVLTIKKHWLELYHLSDTGASIFISTNIDF